jgi:Gluconate 2-dehydrogenase subunit 3
MSEPFRVDRRTAFKWVLAAWASVPLLQRRAFGAEAASATGGYGTDPDLTKIYKPGELWPLTLTPPQRRTAAALCDVIIPADAESPSASAVGVVDFLDEWISAPYPVQQEDRKAILWGLAWLDAEANGRFGAPFAALGEPQKTTICDDICHVPKAKPQFAEAAGFFAKYRDLTAGGFYTTPAGTRDLKYVGNVPLARFDGPPPEVLRKIGVGQAPT